FGGFSDRSGYGSPKHLTGRIHFRHPIPASFKGQCQRSGSREAVHNSSSRIKLGPSKPAKHSVEKRSLPPAIIHLHSRKYLFKTGYPDLVSGNGRRIREKYEC